MLYSVSSKPLVAELLRSEFKSYVSGPEVYLAKKQVYENSCGAACLLCVAKELGVEKIPVFLGSESEKLGSESLELDSRCESDLYKITSGSTTQRLQNEIAGYSMPDGIVTAGRLLGLEMSVEEVPGLFSKALNWFYPEAKSRLASIGCVIAHGPQRFEGDQIKIEAMAVVDVALPVGLHWVVKRSDGTYMDPSTGENYHSFSALNAGAKEIGNPRYYKTGILIIASKMPLGNLEDSTRKSQWTRF
ncbi:hypothetical protein [Pseudomonas zeae]|uniref:hypothetical protein n=1 Tax=Pseudomonas zeae TaxID=2745510 RepID=UPI0039E01FF4